MRPVTSPEGEPMTVEQPAFDVRALEELLRMNPSVDWRAHSQPDPLSFVSLRMPPEADRLAVVSALKGYQRLLAVLPQGEEGRALPLLKAGLHSAVQIASLPRAEVAEVWETLFPGEAELGEQVRRNAIARRSQVALHYVRSLQSNEPHYLAARFR